MSLEAFVRASGDVMGLARDSFGLNLSVGAGGVSTPGQSPLAAGFCGCGQAATAANNESNVVNGQFSALGEQNLAANAHLDGALTAAGAGRGQMDTVISAALADINSLAAGTTTLQGQLALMTRLVNHLENTWQALTDGNSDASTRAASSAQLAAAYNGMGNFQVGGTASMSPMSVMGATSPASFTGTMAPMGAMSPTQMMPMLAAQSMAANQAALSPVQQVGNIQQQSAANGNGQRRGGRVPNHPRINIVLSRAMGSEGCRIPGVVAE